MWQVGQLGAAPGGDQIEARHIVVRALNLTWEMIYHIQLELGHYDLQTVG